MICLNIGSAIVARITGNPDELVWEYPPTRVRRLTLPSTTDDAVMARVRSAPINTPILLWRMLNADCCGYAMVKHHAGDTVPLDDVYDLLMSKTDIYDEIPSI